MTKNISLIEFNRLNTDEKAWYLWHGATFLHVYETGKHRVNLFHLNNYYIELWYNLDGNNIDKIGAFTKLEKLTPFLDRITIDVAIN